MSANMNNRMLRAQRNGWMRRSLVLVIVTLVVLWTGLMFLGSSTNNNMVNAQSLSLYDLSSDDFLTQLIIGSALDDDSMGVNSDGTNCVNQLDETDIDYYQSLIDSTSFYYLKLDSTCEVVALAPNITANSTLNSTIAINNIIDTTTTTSDLDWLINDGYLFEPTTTQFCDQASMEAQMDEDIAFKLLFASSLDDAQSLFSSYMDISGIISGFQQDEYTVIDCSVPVVNSTQNITQNTTIAISNSTQNATTSVSTTITPIVTEDGFDYLSMITDAYLYEPQQTTFCDQASLEAQQEEDMYLKMLFTSSYQSDILGYMDLGAVVSGLEQEYTIVDCSVPIVTNLTSNSSVNATVIVGTTTTTTSDSTSDDFAWLVEPYIFDISGTGSEIKEFCDQESLDAQQLSDSLLRMQLGSADYQQLFTDLFDLSSVASGMDEIQYILKDCSVSSPPTNNVTNNTITQTILQVESEESFDWYISGPFLFDVAAPGSEIKEFCDQESLDAQQLSDSLLRMQLGSTDYQQLFTDLVDVDSITSGMDEIQYILKDCSVSSPPTNNVTNNTTTQVEPQEEESFDWYISGPFLFDIAAPGSEIKEFCDQESLDAQQLSDSLLRMQLGSTDYQQLFTDLVDVDSITSGMDEIQYILKDCTIPATISNNTNTTTNTDVGEVGESMQFDWGISGVYLFESTQTVFCDQESKETREVDDLLYGLLLGVDVSELTTSLLTQDILATETLFAEYQVQDCSIQISNQTNSTSSNITPVESPESGEQHDWWISEPILFSSEPLQFCDEKSMIEQETNDLLYEMMFYGANAAALQPSGFSISNLLSGVEEPQYSIKSCIIDQPIQSNKSIEWSIQKLNNSCIIGGDATIVNCVMIDNSTVHLTNSSYLNYTVTLMPNSYTVMVSVHPDSGYNNVSQVIVSLFDTKIVAQLPNIYLVTKSNDRILIGSYTGDSLISIALVINGTNLQVFMGSTLAYTYPNFDRSAAGSILVGRSPSSPIDSFSGDLIFFSVVPSVSSNLSEIFATVTNGYHSSTTTIDPSNTDITWSITKNGSNCMIGQAIVQNCNPTSNSTLLLSNGSFVSLNLNSQLTDSFIISIVAKPLSTTNSPQVLLDVGTDLKVIVRFPYVILVVNGVETVIYTLPSDPSTVKDTSFIIQYLNPGLSVLVNNEVRYQNSSISQIPNSNNILIGKSDDMSNTYPFNGELSFFELLTNNINNQTLSNVINTVSNVVSSNSANNYTTTTTPTNSNSSNTDVTWSITKDGSNCKIGQAIVQNCNPSSNSSLLLSNGSFISLNLNTPLTDDFIVSVVAKPSTTSSEPQVLLDIGTNLKVIIRYPNVILVVDGVETIIYTYPTTGSGSNSPNPTSFVVQFTDPGLTVFVDGISKYQNSSISQIPNSNNILIGKSDDMSNTYPFNGELSFFELLTNNINNQTLANIIDTVSNVVSSNSANNTSPQTSNTDVTWSIVKDGSNCRIGQAIVQNCNPSSNSSLLLSNGSFISLNLNTPLTDDFIVSVVAKPSTTTSEPQVLLDIGTELKVIIRYPNVILVVDGVETIIYTYPTTGSGSNSPNPTSFVVQFTDPGLTVFVDGISKYQNSSVSQIPNSNNILIGKSDDMSNTYPFNGELSFFELLTNNVNNQTLSNVIDTVSNVVSSNSANNTSPTSNTDVTWSITKDGSNCKIGQAIVQNCNPTSNSSLLLSNGSFISLNLNTPLTDDFIVSVVAKPSTTTSEPQVLLDIGTNLKVIIRYPNVILVVDGVETIIYTYPTTGSGSNSPNPTSFVVQFTDPGLTVFVDGTSKYQNSSVSQIPNSNNILIGKSDDMLNTYPFNGELSFFELLTNNVNNQTLNNVIDTVSNVVNTFSNSENPDVTWSIIKDGSNCKIGQAIVQNCNPTSNSTLLLSNNSFVSLDLNSPLNDNFVISVVAKPSTSTNSPQVLLDIGTGLMILLNPQNVSLSLLGKDTVIYSNGSMSEKPLSLMVEFSDPGLVLFVNNKLAYQDNTASIPNSDNILIGRTNDLPNPLPFTGELVYFELLTNNITQQTITTQMSIVNKLVQTNTKVTTTNTETSSPQEPPKTFCFGISKNSSLSCSGNGECVSNNTCSCKDSYVGLQCELPLCFGSVNCSNGVCISPDTCKCNTGHTGSKCQYSTFADECSGSFTRAFGPSISDDQLVYRMVLVDAKCGKTIVMQSEVLLDKVTIPDNQTIQEMITTTNSPKGLIIMSFDPALHKQQKDSLMFALINLQENSFNATVKTLSTLDQNNQPTSGLTLGQSKVLFNKDQESYAITSDITTSQAQLYSLNFDSNSAALVNNLGVVNTATKFLLGGNIVFDPITNTSTYSFIVTDNGKNVMATIPLTSAVVSTPVETVNIPFSENTVFAVAVANTETKEQFLINVLSNGTEIVSVVPSLKSENVTFTSLQTDADFSVSNVDNLIVDTQNNKITLTNTEDSTSITVQLSAITAENPFEGVSKMIASTDSSFSFVADTTPVYSVEIKQFSKLYFPVSGGTVINFEGNLDVSFKPTLGVYLVFTYDGLYSQRLSIQKTSTNGVYQVNTKEMKNLPSQLADLNSFQVSARVEIVDFKSSSAEPLLDVPYTDHKFTVYANRIDKLSPVLGYIGDNVVIDNVFVPEKTATVKLSNTDSSIEVNVDADRVSASSVKFKIPQLNVDTVLLDLQMSIESNIFSTTTQTKFRYVSPSVQQESASSIFSTETTVETVSTLPQTAGVPLISKIELPKSRDGSAMVFKPNINASLCSEMPVLRQYVSSSKKFDISKLISFKIILPTKFTSGNLFEVWFSKAEYLFVSLSYDTKGRRIHFNDTEISEPCSYDLGETYEFRLSYSDQKFSVKLVHDVLGTVCDASYKTILNDFTNYTMSVGQSFNCNNQTAQIDSLTSFALYDVAEKTSVFVANIRTEPLDVLALALGIPLALLGLLGALLAAGIVVCLWRRHRRKSKFGKFVYYNETNANRERTIADLFEKISEPGSSDSHNQTTETEGFADIDDLSYGSFSNSFNAWV